MSAGKNDYSCTEIHGQLTAAEPLPPILALILVHTIDGVYTHSKETLVLLYWEVSDDRSLYTRGFKEGLEQKQNLRVYLESYSLQGKPG